MQTNREGFVPALRFDALTPAYDSVVRWTTRERTIKRALLQQAGIEPGQSILDLGCGTGTLAISTIKAHPGVSVHGLDGDAKILRLAQAKAAAAGVEVTFAHGFSQCMPYDDGSFDRVLSSLFFHHLDWTSKCETAREVVRILTPGGEVHVADWGRPSGPLMRAAFLPVQWLDGFSRTQDNLLGRLPDAFEEAGCVDVVTTRSFDTPLGTMSLIRARKLT